jgi:oligoribonuclease (3'-5' exoribonuclease)
MISIFYDLETTDLERVGQILNFAFVVVDQDFKELDALTAKVKISRLQLPRVGAILANKTNVLSHQQEATLTEAEAVSQISAFIKNWLKKAGGEDVSFVGFNSSKFDLDYLRTVFIRNGESPYFQHLVSRDVLLLSRYLLATNEDFREKIFNYYDKEKVSLKMESLCKIFSLLDEAQEHESYSDVLLTIALAKTLLSQYRIDVRTFQPYKVNHLHQEKLGGVYTLTEPISRNYTKDKYVFSYPATLLDADQRYALWIDLDKFEKLKSKDNSEELKSCIKWRKFIEYVVLETNEPIEDKYKSLAIDALQNFKNLSLKNYFSETNCDIEQFIYRINFSDIDRLKSLFCQTKLPNGLPSDVVQLTRRFWLENYTDEHSEDFLEALRRYALYRYGGKLKLRSTTEETTTDSANHPTLKALLTEIESALSSSIDNDKKLVEALKSFYLDSDIYRVAGKELLS